MKSFIAVVLINVELGNNEEEVKNEILKIGPPVKEAHVVYGVFSIYVLLEGDKEEITNAVKRKIRPIKGIRSTLTMLGTQ